MREFLSGKYLIFFSIRQAKCVRNRQSERVRCCTLGFSSLNCMLLRNNILEIVYKTSHKLLYNVNFKSTLMHFIFVHRHDINRIYFFVFRALLVPLFALNQWATMNYNLRFIQLLFLASEATRLRNAMLKRNPNENNARPSTCTCYSCAFRS